MTATDTSSTRLRSRARVRSVRRCGGTRREEDVSPLSQREAEVLELVRTGHTTKDIAAQLGISTSTVLWHRKLAIARQTAAAAPNRVPSSRTTSTSKSTSASAVRQLMIAGRKATTPR